MQQQIHNFSGKRGYFNIVAVEQSAVYVGKRREQGVVVRKVRVAFFGFLVEHAEQVAQGFTGVDCVELRHVIVKHILFAEYARILGV